MEHSLGHSPACLFKFNVRRIMFLRLPYESIENLYVSFTLPRVNNALKWIIMRLECILALSSLGDFVSWNWRVLGSLFSLASLIYPSDASQRCRDLAGESSYSILLCLER